MMRSMNSETQTSLLDQIRIVLIGTTHPGNIGAAARAMKTMGLQDLCLVAPRCFPHEEATARASGADDVLCQAQVFPDLDAALADVTIAIATTARSRSLPWPVMTPREMATFSAEKLRAHADHKIAIVFGRERSGMSNEELMRCQAAVTVDANPQYSSLNLAAAVQIMAYECRHAAMMESIASSDQEAAPLATQDDLLRFYDHLEETMIAVEYLNPEKPKRLPERLRRLFNRTSLAHSEVQLLRGFLSAVQRQMKTRS